MSLGRKSALALFVAGIAVLGGYYGFKRYMQVVTGGKTVREGVATVVEVRKLGCEEAKRDALDEFNKNQTCWPEEKVLCLYLRVDDFRTLEPQDSAYFLSRERQNESKGNWRCEDLHYYLEDVPHVRVGESRKFQFQFFSPLFFSDRSALIFLSSCRT